MSFDWTKKVAGILSGKQNKINELANQVDDRDALVELQEHRHWPLIRRILQEFYSEAVSELGKRNIEEMDYRRINNRVELLQDIQKKFDSILHKGNAARIALDKLSEKEKSNV